MTKKVERRQTTLVDILVVARALPQDEVKQIFAFGGNPDPEGLALGLMQQAAFMWTIAEVETGEPLAVGGYVQTGPTIFRSFFLANQRAWDEHGREVTEVVTETIQEILKGFEYVRLETYCLPERKKARKWYGRIGLSFDAELEGFGVKGAAAVLYSVVGKPALVKPATVSEVRMLGKQQVN